MAPLAPMNSVGGGSFGEDLRWGGEPLFDVAAAVLTLFILHSANGLTGG